MQTLRIPQVRRSLVLGVALAVSTPALATVTIVQDNRSITNYAFARWNTDSVSLGPETLTPTSLAASFNPSGGWDPIAPPSAPDVEAGSHGWQMSSLNGPNLGFGDATITVDSSYYVEGYASPPSSAGSFEARAGETNTFDIVFEIDDNYDYVLRGSFWNTMDFSPHGASLSGYLVQRLSRVGGPVLFETGYGPYYNAGQLTPGQYRMQVDFALDGTVDTAGQLFIYNLFADARLQLTRVPEPAALTLLGLGALMSWRRLR